MAAAAAGAPFAMITSLLMLVVVLAMIISMWKVFEKAGKPGWGVIIPIYNGILALEIAGRPIWWIILFFIPVISIIPAFIIPLGIAKKFGKGAGFGIGLIFLPFIFYPILGFGDADCDANR